MMNLRASQRPRVLIVGADDSTFALLQEWLLADDIEAIANEGSARGGAATSPERTAGNAAVRPLDGCDVVLVDISFPRDRGIQLLRTVATEHPGTPIVALSSGFFANVGCSGPCARQLGVAGVLPKPVAREALLEALRKLFVVPPP